MPNKFGKFNFPYKLLTIKRSMLVVAIAVGALLALFPFLYEVKTKAGVDISHSRHAGPFLQKHTRGLFKCEWLYPYRPCSPPPEVKKY